LENAGFVYISDRNTTHQKLIRVYFLEANRAMCRNRIFSSPKCRKWTSAKHKKQV